MFLVVMLVSNYCIVHISINLNLNLKKFGISHILIFIYFFPLLKNQVENLFCDNDLIYT